MRNRKHVFVDFAFFDRTGIQRFLEKKALQGWMLKDATGLIWEFDRMESQKLCFSVVYFPNEKTSNGFADERREDFMAYCRHSGWELAASRNSMLIWYHTAEDPVPIETDPVMELEMIHKTAKQEHLILRYSHVIFGISYLLMYVVAFSVGKFHKVMDSLMFYFGIYEIVVGILSGYELIQYYSWRKKARLAAQLDGSFVETRSYPFVNIYLRVSVIAVYLIYLVSVTNLPILYVGIGLAVLMACTWALAKLMRSRSMDSQEQEKSSFSLMLELVAIFILILLILVLFAVFLGSMAYHIYQIEN